MCLFVHADGTTGQHARERRRHAHSARCAQCGVELTDATRVAAHLHVRPLGLVRCFTTLQSTCKACNHYRHARRPRSFWGFRRNLPRLRPG